MIEQFISAGSAVAALLALVPAIVTFLRQSDKSAKLDLAARDIGQKLKRVMEIQHTQSGENRRELEELIMNIEVDLIEIKKDVSLSASKASTPPADA